MIPAKKGPLFERWFIQNTQSRLFGAFGTIEVRGLAAVRQIAATDPILFVSNHTAWWDPLVILYLASRVLELDAFALMDAKNLERLPFFRKVGAFGVHLDDPLDGARAMRYAAKLLDRPGRAVWVFPQGRERPITLRPLGFRPGSAEIARLAPRSVVIPVGLRYEHGAEPKPRLLASFGSPLARDRAVDRALLAQEAAVTRELDALDRALLEDASTDFEVLHRSISSRTSSFAELALAWLTRDS